MRRITEYDIKDFVLPVDEIPEEKQKQTQNSFKLTDESNKAAEVLKQENAPKSQEGQKPISKSHALNTYKKSYGCKKLEGKTLKKKIHDYLLEQERAKLEKLRQKDSMNLIENQTPEQLFATDMTSHSIKTTMLTDHEIVPPTQEQKLKREQTTEEFLQQVYKISDLL